MEDKKNLNKETEGLKKESDFSVWNIFEDFENDEILEQEINKSESEIKKDSFYYLSLGSNFLKMVNLIFFILIIISFVYIKIQNLSKPNEILNPMCYILLWKDVSYEKIPKTWTGNNLNSCMSIKLAEEKTKKALEEESFFIYSKLLKIATDFYTMKDFINSKEVIFLLNASEDKKNPLDLLVKFDKAKNDFLLSDKLRIQCRSIEVTDTELKAECDAYSSLWDTSIPWYDWEKNQNDLKGGTSISIASSFLNFLEKQEDFILLNKQKVFNIQSITWQWAYSFKTPFKIYLTKRDLKLK